MRLFDFRILVSIWISLACLLGLQIGLNALKYRTLVLDAAAARAQIPAGTIENAMERARSLGLPIGEIAGLETVLADERARTEDLRAVRVLDPGGRTLLETADAPLEEGLRERLRRRLIARGDAEGWIEIDGALHVGRLVSGADGTPIALILQSFDSAGFGADISNVRRGLVIGGIAIFLVTCIVLTPVVLVAFAPARRLLRALGSADLDRLDPPDAKGLDALECDVAEQIVAGNRAEAEVAAALDRIAAGERAT